MIKIHHSLYCDSKDLKFILLSKIFKIIASNIYIYIYSCNGIINSKMMEFSLKLIFLTIYFNYHISEGICELNKCSELRKFCGF